MRKKSVPKQYINNMNRNPTFITIDDNLKFLINHYSKKIGKAHSPFLSKSIINNIHRRYCEEENKVNNNNN